jgi:hypothetical protein
VPTDAARLINIGDSLRKINPNNPKIPEMNHNIQNRLMNTGKIMERMSGL